MLRKFLPLLMLTLFCWPLSAQALIGVSPAGITIDKVLNGIPQQHTVSISRSHEEFDQDAYYDVIIRGQDAAYVTGEKTIFMPAGVDHFDYTFTINPKDLANGIYSASIDFLYRIEDLQAELEGGTGAIVRPGVTLVLGFRVTDETVLSYELSQMIVGDIEEGMPVSVSYGVKNTGNVNWRPDSIIVSVTDVTQKQTFQTLNIAASEIEYVLPGQELRRELELPAQLKQGVYLVRMDFFYNGKLVYSDTKTLTVYVEGTFKQSGELKTVSANKVIFSPGENIKLTGVFINNGEIAYKAKMITEAYKGEELVDTLVSNELRVEIGELVQFSQTTSFDKVGSYYLVSFVEYGNKTSGTKSIDLVVESVPLSTAAKAGIGVGMTVLLISIGAGVMRWRKPKFSTAATSPTPPVSTAPPTPPAAVV